MKAAPKKKPEVAQLPAVENFARIAASAQAIVNATDSILRERGASLGIADWALMQLLAAEKEPLPMVRIAVRMGVTRQRIQKQAEALAQAKYVEMHESDGDKRFRALKLAKPGAEALKSMSARFGEPLATQEAVSKLQNLDLLRERVQRIATILAQVHWKGLQAARLGKSVPGA
jgi:DNA-binding MarR family transcriptional regulator